MRYLNDRSIIEALRCPNCKEKMHISDNGSSLVCEGKRMHCYDFSASGYVNMLSPSQSGGGDSKDAVKARSLFLNTDIYRPVANAISEMLSEFSSSGKTVLDAGCGEGYYSEIIAQNGFSLIGADISKFAVDAAAKRASRQKMENAFFVAASIFELPVFDSSCDFAISIFAPCSEIELSRVLKKDGILIVAWAGEKHLIGLKNVIYDVTYDNEGRADLPKSMELVCERRVKYTARLNSNEQIMNLFSMTPYYLRTSPADKQKLCGVETLDTEIDVMITAYKNNKDLIGN